MKRNQRQPQQYFNRIFVLLHISSFAKDFPLSYSLIFTPEICCRITSFQKSASSLPLQLHYNGKTTETSYTIHDNDVIFPKNPLNRRSALSSITVSMLSLTGFPSCSSSTVTIPYDPQGEVQVVLSGEIKKVSAIENFK